MVSEKILFKPSASESRGQSVQVDNNDSAGWWIVPPPAHRAFRCVESSALCSRVTLIQLQILVDHPIDVSVHWSGAGIHWVHNYYYCYEKHRVNSRESPSIRRERVTAQGQSLHFMITSLLSAAGQRQRQTHQQQVNRQRRRRRRIAPEPIDNRIIYIFPLVVHW